MGAVAAVGLAGVRRIVVKLLGLRMIVQQVARLRRMALTGSG